MRAVAVARCQGRGPAAGDQGRGPAAGDQGSGPAAGDQGVATSDGPYDRRALSRRPLVVVWPAWGGHSKAPLGEGRIF